MERPLLHSGVRKSPSIPMVCCLAWLAVSGSGFVALSKYQNASGSVGATPSDWPARASVALDQKRDTLIMFVHPQCPCSSASVEELNRLLARHSESVSARVCVFKPKGFSENWTRSSLWRAVAAIPGVTVQEDVDGAQARVFGAETSGFVLLYNARGKLLFKGGITGSRGHAGDNAGEDTIVSLLAGQKSGLLQTPVYGCSLLGKCQAPAP